MRLAWHCCLFIAAAVLSVDALALDARKRTSQYVAQQWSLSEGLTDTYIQALAQTPDGYLWIGTQNSGLVRFDGVRFAPVKPPFGGAAGEASIRALAVTPDGTLWIGTDGFGLWSLRDGKFRRFGRMEGVPNDNVRALLVDRHGRVWAACSGATVRMSDGGSFESFLPGGKGARPQVYALHEGKDGTIWLAGDGLWAWRNGVIEDHSAAFAPQRGNFVAICGDWPEGLWLGGKEGLWHYDENSVKRLTEADGLSDTRVRALKVDYERTLWIGSLNGVDRLVGDRIETCLTREGVPYDLIYTIFEDREGSLWIGSNGGLAQLKDDAFALLTTAQGLSQNIVLAVLEARDESFWIGTWSKGVTHLEGSKATVYGKHQGLDSSSVRALHEAADDTIWLSTEGGGLSRIRDGAVETWRPENLGGETIVALQDASAQELWAVTDKNRLLRGAGPDWHAANLTDQRVFTIHSGPSGRFWVATDHSVKWLTPSAAEWQEVELPQESRGKIIRSLTETTNGDLWVCGQNTGLLRLRDGAFRIFSKGEGLEIENYYTVGEDANSDLWIGCKRGLFFLSRASLADFDAGVRTGLAPVDYTTISRLQTPRFTRFGFPLTEKMHDGRLCFPTTKGVAIIDPERLPYNRVAPNVLIENIVLDHHTEVRGASVQVPPGTRDIRVDFTATSLRSPDRVRFRYRLDGFQNQWVETRQTRTAFYQNLKPGAYRFEVHAANEDGIWSERGAAVELQVLPMFYQTAGFKFLAGAVLLCAGFATFRLRMRQQRRKIAAMLAERTRIARELHDTLEQGLVGVTMQLNMAGIQAAKEHFAGRKYLERARYMLKHSMADARSAILDLRREAEPKDLYAELRRIAEEMTADQAIAVECTQRGTPAQLSYFLVTTLLRIGQEAITNALKHASPKRIAIELAHGPIEVTLTIEDDGCGFDPGALAALENEHFGLLGARERTEKLGGILQIESFRGEGTRLVVRLPVSRRGALRSSEPDIEVLTHG